MRPAPVRRGACTLRAPLESRYVVARDGPAVFAGEGREGAGSVSRLGQVIYNIEISRDTLYTGEPIFTGFVNKLLLPKELRPGAFATTCMTLAGCFFLFIGTVATLHDLRYI